MCKQELGGEMKRPEKKTEQRSNIEQLGNVCLDCWDFLKHPCVNCEDCPVFRLKELAKALSKRIGK